MIVNETGVNALHFVSADRRANAAAADCDSPIHLTRDHCMPQRYNVIGVIVTRIQAVSTEIDYLMSCRTDPRNQFFLQSKSAVIRGDAYAHGDFSTKKLSTMSVSAYCFFHPHSLRAPKSLAASKE